MTTLTDDTIDDLRSEVAELTEENELLRELADEVKEARELIKLAFPELVYIGKPLLEIVTDLIDRAQR